MRGIILMLRITSLWVTTKIYKWNETAIGLGWVVTRNLFFFSVLLDVCDQGSYADTRKAVGL